MYLSDDLTERAFLRQGDIICDTHLLGAINLNSIIYEVNAAGDKVGWRASAKPTFGPAIVLSHSCELDRDGNGIKVTSIILAPIRDVNKATSPEKVRELIESNFIGEDTTHSYLKYFYLEPHQLLSQFPNGTIADFSKIYSVRKQSYDLLVQNKVLQLDYDVVGHLATKLALYYYRQQTA